MSRHIHSGRHVIFFGVLTVCVVALGVLVFWPQAATVAGHAVAGAVIAGVGVLDWAKFRSRP